MSPYTLKIHYFKYIVNINVNKCYRKINKKIDIIHEIVYNVYINGYKTERNMNYEKLSYYQRNKPRRRN